MTKVTHIHENEVVCYCPLEGIIDVISKKWALLIINAIGNYGSLRFNRISEELQGISPKTLADTLKQLQNEGLLKRESFAEIPPRVEYSLTEDGRGLREAVVPILKWAARRQGSKRKRCSVACKEMPAHRIRNGSSSSKRIWFGHNFSAKPKKGLKGLTQNTRDIDS